MAGKGGGKILSPVGFRACLKCSNKRVKYFLKSDSGVSASYQKIFYLFSSCLFHTVPVILLSLLFCWGV